MKVAFGAKSATIRAFIVTTSQRHLPPADDPPGTVKADFVALLAPKVAFTANTAGAGWRWRR